MKSAELYEELAKVWLDEIEKLKSKINGSRINALELEALKLNIDQALGVAQVYATLAQAAATQALVEAQPRKPYTGPGLPPM